MLDRKGRCLGFRVSVSLGIERTPSKLPKTAATMQRGVHVEVVLAASIGHSCIIVKLCRFSPALQSRKKHFVIGDVGYDSSQGPAPAIGTNRRELMLYQFVLI